MRINDVIICDCHTDEHQIIFKYDTEDKGWENVFISYHLQNHNFWDRLKYGIKYIFGYRSRYGGWGELILSTDKETIRKFENVLKYLKKIKNKK